MTISRNISVLAQGASTAGILAGGYGGLGASISPTAAGNTIFTTDGSTWSSTQKIVRGTAVATTSGTAIDFTGIPSWAKRITVMFQGVSTNGTSLKLLQIGSGSVTTTGYVATATYLGPGLTTNSSTSGFLFNNNLAAEIISGLMTITSLGSNIYIASGVIKISTAYTLTSAGDVTLSGALDRVRFTTVNGTDAFDAGNINIFYE